MQRISIVCKCCGNQYLDHPMENARTYSLTPNFGCHICKGKPQVKKGRNSMKDEQFECEVMISPLVMQELKRLEVEAYNQAIADAEEIVIENEEMHMKLVKLFKDRI